MGRIKLNFQLIVILLVGVSVLLIILISIISPNAIIPFNSILGVPSSYPVLGSEFSPNPYPNQLIQQGDSDIYYLNSDQISVNGDEADYFYFSSPPDSKTLDFVKSQLNVTKVNVIDSTYLNRPSFDPDANRPPPTSTKSSID